MPNPGVSACSRPGTEGSNPSPSSGESAANLTPTMEHETEVMPSYSMADIGYPLSFMAFGKTRLNSSERGRKVPRTWAFNHGPGTDQIPRRMSFIHGFLRLRENSHGRTENDRRAGGWSALPRAGRETA